MHTYMLRLTAAVTCKMNLQNYVCRASSNKMHLKKQKRCSSNLKNVPPKSFDSAAARRRAPPARHGLLSARLPQALSVAAPDTLLSKPPPPSLSVGRPPPAPAVAAERTRHPRAPPFAPAVEQRLPAVSRNAVDAARQNNGFPQPAATRSSTGSHGHQERGRHCTIFLSFFCEGIFLC
jgi:hypothetical protein